MLSSEKAVWIGLYVWASSVDETFPSLSIPETHTHAHKDRKKKNNMHVYTINKTHTVSHTFVHNGALIDEKRKEKECDRKQCARAGCEQYTQSERGECKTILYFGVDTTSQLNGKITHTHNVAAETHSLTVCFIRLERKNEWNFRLWVVYFFVVVRWAHQTPRDAML